MIYRFRVILDADEDVFRDIEIEDSTNMEEFHNIICQSFGLEGDQMASFYVSDEEWNQGEEISLFDMSDGSRPVRIMLDTQLLDVLDRDNTRMIYLYDFMSMWTFYVELADVADPEPGVQYPRVIYDHGQLPDSPPEKKFEADDMDEMGGGDSDPLFDDDDEFEDDYDLDSDLY